MSKAKENTKMTEQRIKELYNWSYDECARIQQITSVLCLLRDAIEEDDLVRWPAVMLLIDLMDKHHEAFIELTSQMVALMEEANK